MLPTAGLFLPETLHRRLPMTTMEADSTRLSFFARQSARSKSDTKSFGKNSPSTADSSLDRSQSSPTSLSIASGYADFVLASRKPSSESTNFATLIHQVREHVKEASRLYLSPTVKNFLDAWPDKRSYIDIILNDVRSSLDDIGTYVNNVGNDVEGISLRRRYEWVLGHHKKIATRQQALASCHQSLMTAIGIMQTVELCGVSNGMWQDPIYEAPVQPWVKREDSHLMRGPYSRQKARVSQKNLRSTSIHSEMSEKDGADVQSIDSIPNELPGSTPDDIVDPDNMDLYNAPSEQIRESQRRQAEPATTTKDASTNLSVVPSCSSPARQSSWSREDTPPPNNSPDHIPPTITGTPRAAHSSIHTSSSPSHVMLANISTACQSSSPTEIVSAPLPTLSEDRLERNDSTMSTGVVVTDSKVARRHQPTSVYIRKSQERHHSLPTMLPLVESQPSLADDLSKWILPVSHRKKLGGTEWKSYRPGIPQPESSSENFPGKEQRMEDDQIRRVATPDFPEEIETCNLSPGSRVISLRRSTELFFDVPVRHSHTEADRKDIRPQQRHSLDRDSSTSIRSTTSSITRKPIPTPSILQLAINTPLPELPKTTHSHYDIEKDIGVESSSEVNQPNDEVRNSVEDAASTASTPTPSSSSNSISSAILVESPTTHLSDDAELSLLQQRLLCQTYVTPKINGSKPTSKEATQIEQVSEKIKHAKHVKEDRSEELSAKGQDLDRSETSTEEIMRVTAELEKPPSVGNVPPIVEDALSSLDDELPSVDDELPAAGKESFSVDVEPIFKVPTPADTFKAATDSLKKVHEDETPRPIPTAPQRPPPALSSKPLTAQARRRAAHQRRMELAFGAD